MTIYVIAGPPGIGKSTNAGDFIPVGVPIVDQDLAGYQYKKRGFTDYQDLASLSTNQRIRDYLFSEQDFALELNLGFPSHYAYLKSIAFFNPANKLNLLIFFTDDLNLCIDRARVRHLSGGHEVKPVIIEEMYANTLPLLTENRHLFHTIRLFDIAESFIIEYTRTSTKLADWIINDQLDLYLSA
jgi:predicted ABC-type ATPase